MPHPHRPTTSLPDVDVDAAVRRWVDDDAGAALDFLIDHAGDVPQGHQIAECLTRSRRPHRAPVGAELRAG